MTQPQKNVKQSSGTQVTSIASRAVGVILICISLVAFFLYKYNTNMSYEGLADQLTLGGLFIFLGIINLFLIAKNLLKSRRLRKRPDYIALLLAGVLLLLVFGLGPYLQ